MSENLPGYWRHYRATPPDYVERDNRRRRLSRKRALGAAKQDAILRRLNGVVEFLLWKETAAKQGPIVLTASSA